METRRQQQKGNCGSGVMAVRLPERAQKGNRCGLANDLCNSPICTRSANCVSSIQGATGNDRPRHARVQAWRARSQQWPKQAIAIGLREAGASKYESKEQNRHTRARSKIGGI